MSLDHLLRLRYNICSMGWSAGELREYGYRVRDQENLQQRVGCVHYKAGKPCNDAGLALAGWSFGRFGGPIWPTAENNRRRTPVQAIESTQKDRLLAIECCKKLRNTQE
jgi:hypothetical protein